MTASPTATAPAGTMTFRSANRGSRSVTDACRAPSRAAQSLLASGSRTAAGESLSSPAAGRGGDACQLAHAGSCRKNFPPRIRGYGHGVRTTREAMSVESLKGRSGRICTAGTLWEAFVVDGEVGRLREDAASRRRVLDFKVSPRKPRKPRKHQLSLSHQVGPISSVVAAG